MEDRPASPPKLQRSSTTNDMTYTFPTQPYFIMRDLMKKGLLQPLAKYAQDDNIPMGMSNIYCTYHQRKGHAMNFCKTLEATISDFIAQGKYQIDENT